MEATSENVQWKEKSNVTLSTVTKKSSIQEVSATSMQKLSSSTSVDSDSLIGSSQLVTDAIKIMSPDTAMGSSVNPIVNSSYPADSDNVLGNTSLQNEFIAMAIRDEHGNEIGQLMQQNQQQQSVNSSSFVTTLDSGSTSTSLTKLSTAKSSSVMQQTIATAEVASSSSSSVSCSSYSSAQKQEIVSSTKRSLASSMTAQSFETNVKSSSIAAVEDHVLEN